MKKILSLFLAVIMMFSLASVVSVKTKADTFSGTCGENLTWTLDTETGTLEISGSGEMEDYIDNYSAEVNNITNAPWSGYSNFIKNVVINEGVTSIGACAFHGCSSLTSIEIPSSVTSIGFEAFCGCTSLLSIVIPSSVTSIENYTFFECSSLTSINISSSVTSIGQFAFACCKSLTSIEIPSSVIYIEIYAFEGCTSMTNIEIPSSVTHIGSHAFEYTGYYNDSANWDNGVLYIGNILIAAEANITAVEIKEGTRMIAGGAFFDCSNLKSVKIPSSMTIIGRSAFAGCDGLTSIDIPSSVTIIEDNAFIFCESLTSIEIPSSVTIIKGAAFANCKSLKSITIPSSVISIGNLVFYGCGFDLIVCGYTGSEAETYAKNNGITFVPLDSESFSDISSCSSGIKKAIDWADANGIVMGYSDGIFRPFNNCTRQQMVIMLWRLAGKPEPASINSALNFTDTSDLTSGSKKAIAWAVEQGIISGYKDGTFRPTDNVTRQQTVVMLWRLKGKPVALSTSTFTDTASCSAGVMKAINWAASVEITKGSKQSDGTYKFNPDDPCQRQHIATFVYRYANLMK